MGHRNSNTRSPFPGGSACGASFYNYVDSAGYDNIATTQEKNQAGMGAGDSKRDRCKKGKSCGAACIFYRKDCILELPETVQEPMMRVRNMLKEAVAKGHLTDDEAGNVFQKHMGLTDDIKWGREDLRAEKNLKTMKDVATRMKNHADELDQAREVVRRESKSEEDFNRKIDNIHEKMYGGLGAIRSEKTSSISPEGVEFAQQRKAVFLKGDEIMAQSNKEFKEGTLTAKTMNDRMAPIAEALKPDKGKYSPAEIAYAAKILTQYETSYMGTAGSLKEGGGFFEKGGNVPSAYGNLERASKEQKEARVLLGTKAYLEQGGRDGYTGQRTSILHMDWEHFIPFESVKKYAEVENNFFLTASRINGGKAANPPSYLVDTAKGLPAMDKRKTTFDENGKMTPESRTKWEAGEAKKTGYNQLKQQGFEAGYYQARVQALKEITGSALYSSLPASDKMSILNKIMYGSLLSRVPGMSETAGGGYWSGLRNDKRWYYYGNENPEFTRSVFKKFMDLHEKGDEAGLAKMGGVLRKYADELNPNISARIPANATLKQASGEKKVVELKPEVTPQVRQIMNEMNDKALKEINAL